MDNQNQPTAPDRPQSETPAAIGDLHAAAMQLASKDRERSRDGKEPAPARSSLDVSKYLKAIDANPTTPQMSAEMRKELDRRAEQNRRQSRWDDLVKQIGTRYRDCSTTNFRVHEDARHAEKQNLVLAEIENYLGNLAAELKAGTGVLLVGPSGTGKDHLMAAMMRVAVLRHGCDVRWAQGVGIYSERRDAITAEKPEKELVDRYAKPEILAISDPVPPMGDLTRDQAETLFKILDERSRWERPTWVTMNVRDSAEAIQRLGPQITGRLEDGAVVLRFDWPTYRRKRR